MTNTEAGLLDDIIANPADDVPRLIYADWLEEHGQEERAKFIRVQIELNQHPECNVIGRHCDGCVRLKRIELHWIEVNRAILTASIPFDVGLWRQIGDTLYLPTAFFRRGFLAEVHAPLDMLLEHLPRLVREQPIEAVRVTDREPFEGIAGILGGGRFVVGWHPLIDPADPRRTDELHRSIFDLLIPGIASRFGRGKYYPTTDAAHAALSVAMLTWAKGHPLTRLEG